MQIVVISDTHGDLRPLQAVPPGGPYDYLLHAGDYLADLPACARIFGVPAERCHGVAGNCDYPVEEPAEAVLDLGGARVLLTHGHLYGVKGGCQRVYYRAAELGCQAAVFGHSHVPVCTVERGILLFNPGSPGRPRLPGQPGSYGILTVVGGRVTGEHVWLRKR